MGITMRHSLVMVAAMIFLVGTMFIPNKILALSSGILSFLAMLAAIFILQAGVKKPVAKAVQALRQFPEAKDFFARPEKQNIYSITDFAAQSIKTATDLQEKLAREQQKAENAELEMARAKEELSVISDQAAFLSEQHQIIVTDIEELYLKIWKLVQMLSQLVGTVTQGVAEQRFRMNEASGSMSLISGQVDQIANSAGSASEQAQSSRDVATTGVQELRVAVDSIEDVKESTLALKKTMTILGEKADNIGRVMGFINDVADQTNLLALNAAIEAARAGESGRGFAVVADEVRNLAKKTMQATDEVAQAVSSIQNQTQLTIQAVENAADQTVQTAERAGTAGTSMSCIVENMELAAQQLETIASATREQSQSSHHTNEALVDIRHVAMRTASQMENFTSCLVELTSSMEKLGNIAYSLRTGNLPAAEVEHLVEWSNKLSTGMRIIDEQHKMLLNYINSLHLAMQRGLTDAQMLDILTVLYDYTVSHFSTEELYFTRSDYRDINNHLEQHRKFTKQIADYREAVANGSAQVSLELLNFLRDWLIHHIQGTDLQYVDSVKRMLKEEQNI